MQQEYRGRSHTHSYQSGDIEEMLLPFLLPRRLHHSLVNIYRSRRLSKASSNLRKNLPEEVRAARRKTLKNSYFGGVINILSKMRLVMNTIRMGL